MVVILPKENVVIWFCSLHNRPDNYLKGTINSSVLFFNTFALALVGNKGLDDTPQSKSKVAARWIVVKVCDLNKSSTYIYFMCVYTNCS